MARLKEEDVKNEISLYKHRFDDQVRFDQVDSFGVVHNLQYFYFLEWARTKYLESVGIELSNRTYTAEHPIMTVHHEIDYFNPAMFTDKYSVYSRVTKIKNSSITFENIIQNENGKILVKSLCILVYLSNEDYKPTRIPDIIRNGIIALESENVELID
jgi:acyl-CoA thioester hydrolase